MAHFLFIRSNGGTHRNKHFSSYFSNYGSDYGSKGTVVNRPLPYLHEGSLEITLTVPLSNKIELKRSVFGTSGEGGGLIFHKSIFYIPFTTSMCTVTVL